MIKLLMKTIIFLISPLIFSYIYYKIFGLMGINNVALSLLCFAVLGIVLAYIDYIKYYYVNENSQDQQTNKNVQSHLKKHKNKKDESILSVINERARKREEIAAAHRRFAHETADRERAKAALNKAKSDAEVVARKIIEEARAYADVLIKQAEDLSKRVATQRSREVEREAKKKALNIIEVAKKDAEKITDEASNEAKSKASALIEGAQERADDLIRKAERASKRQAAQNYRSVENEAIEKASKITDLANKEAEKIINKAKTEADKITNKAKTEAENIIEAAKALADNLKIKSEEPSIQEARFSTTHENSATHENIERENRDIAKFSLYSYENIEFEPVENAEEYYNRTKGEEARGSFVTTPNTIFSAGEQSRELAETNPAVDDNATYLTINSAVSDLSSGEKEIFDNIYKSHINKRGNQKSAHIDNKVKVILSEYHNSLDRDMCRSLAGRINVSGRVEYKDIAEISNKHSQIADPKIIYKNLLSMFYEKGGVAKFMGEGNSADENYIKLNNTENILIDIMRIINNS